MARHDVDLRKREQEAYTVLTDWPDVQALVVGGYAASAWAFPRFSHDLDFLVASEDTSVLRDHLLTQGLNLVDEHPEIDQNYGGSWERWEGGETAVTIDLLVNSIQDRDFKIPLSIGELWKDHSKRPLRGVSESGVVMRVISKEALIALKCQPMRPRDIGDICAIAYTGYDAHRLQRLLSPIIGKKRGLFQERINSLHKTIGTTPDDLQRALGPRIPRFSNIRHDMKTTLDDLLSRLRRWSSQ